MVPLLQLELGFPPAIHLTFAVHRFRVRLKASPYNRELRLSCACKQERPSGRRLLEHVSGDSSLSSGSAVALSTDELFMLTSGISYLLLALHVNLGLGPPLRPIA